jgi:hypothetical protein
MDWPSSKVWSRSTRADQLLIELGQQGGASDEPGVSLPLVRED